MRASEDKKIKNGWLDKFFEYSGYKKTDLTKLLTSPLLRRVEISGGTTELPGIVYRYLTAVAPVLWRANGRVQLSEEFSVEHQAQVKTPVEIMYDCPTLFLYRRRVPILITWFATKQDDGGHCYGHSMYFLRGSVDVDVLLREAMQHYTQTHVLESRFCVHHKTGSGFKSDNRLAQPPNDNIMAKVTSSCARRFIEGDEQAFSMPPPVRASSWMWWSAEASRLREDAMRWLSRRTLFLQRGMPWRRAWRLHGAPGNGKSLLAYAIAEELKLPLYFFDIANMTSQDFIEAWEDVGRDMPAMVLIEDIDATIRGRVNIRSAEHGVGFDTILNCLAGVNQRSGILLVVTTNDPASMDEALCRPGRIDLTVEILPPTEEGRLHIARRILQDEEKAKEVAAALEGHSVAQVQEHCYSMLTDFI